MSGRRKLFLWLAMDGVWWATAVAGVAFGVGWAANLFKFLTVLAAMLAVFTAGATTILVAAESDDIDAMTGHPARKLARYTDAALMFFLAAYGWFGYATLVALMIVCSLWYSGTLDLRKEKMAAEQEGAAS